MLGQQDHDSLPGASPPAITATRRTYFRSVSWSDRSPNKPAPIPRPQQPNGKARSLLPPLQPLSINRRPVEEWPKAGSDDLGVWPNPQTPRGPVNLPDSSNSESPVREFQFKKDKLAFFDKECSRIAEHIYLGSEAVAKNRETLRQNGITHVLNCVGFVCPEYFKSDLVYKTLWLQDSPSEDITSILYDVFDYFEDVREQGGRVLVHCCQGVSRSTSLVIAYLMWREGQSFEDAFQYVKAARGVTNPNMGFACQLLQCQKRVHAVPPSPTSVLRMYRMAPHSPYDALHLVPKMLSQPGVQGLDSRGAFIVHVPTAIFIWVGKHCNSVMSNHARVAANQVVRYERAQGPIVSIKEGEETSEFWDALANGQILADGSNETEVKKEKSLSHGSVYERRVDEYDLDFELFHKAVAGGVVPPFSISNAESETCLPARENGWSRLRQKFASGKMKEFFTSTKMNCGTVSSADGSSDMIIDTCKESEQPVPLVSNSLTTLPTTYPSVSPDTSDGSPDSNVEGVEIAGMKEESSIPQPDTLMPSSSPCGSPDSFSCYPEASPNFSYKSPTLSPSTSDYSPSSFTFSPSSSNWSDLSYLSSRQPSPSTSETRALLCAKADNFCLPDKEPPPLSAKVFSENHTYGAENTCYPCKGTNPSLAERRGSNPPPRMLLPSVEKPSQVPRILVRSWSFSLADSDDDDIKNTCTEILEHECSREVQMLDADIDGAESVFQNSIDGKESGQSHLPLGNKITEAAEVTTAVLYHWPSMNKIEMDGFHILDSGSVYILLAPDLTLDSNNPGVAYVWLGQEVSSVGREIELISGRGTCMDGQLCWEVIGGKFIDQIDFPPTAPVHIVREGKEPEQFLKVLNCFSSQRYS